MKYLMVVPSGGDEMSYGLDKIVHIVCDYAQNILSGPDMHKNGLKPLEMVTMISLKDGKNEIYKTAGSEIFSD